MAEPPKSVASNSAYEAASQIAVVVMGLATGVIASRLLQAEGRGAYVFETSFASILVLGFINFGMESSCATLVGRDRTRLPQLHSLVVLICASAMAALLTMANLGQEYFRGTLLPGLTPLGMWALAIGTPFLAYQAATYGLMVGIGAIRERARFDFVFNLAQNLAVLALIFAFSKGGAAVPWLVGSYYAIAIAGGLMLFANLTRHGTLWQFPKRNLIRDFIQVGAAIYAGNLASNLSQRVDQYCVKQAAGSDALFGIYTLATSLTDRTRLFPQALSRSIYARICAAPQQEAARLVAASFRQMLALGLILLACGTIASPLIPILYSSTFAPAIIPFIIFLVGRLFHNCAWMLANYMTGHMGRPGIPMIINWSLLPFQAAAAWYAMRWGGLPAVAAATSLGYIVLCLLFVLIFLRAQNHARIMDLVILSRRDIDPWLTLLKKRNAR